MTVRLCIVSVTTMYVYDTNTVHSIVAIIYMYDTKTVHGFCGNHLPV